MKIQQPKSPIVMLSERQESPLATLIFFLAICVFAMLATGCQTPAVSEADASSNPQVNHPAYTLAPGDKLRITVYEHENLSGNFTVDEAGTVSLPLIRRIIVEGMTLPEIERAVTQKLLANHIVDPKVSIDLLEQRPFCVFGEVRNPGCYGYLVGMTASKAIAMAGGYTYRAKENELLITRANGRRVAGDHATPVFSGDVIEVPERFF
jgi:polysaccharide export outer membrane protein